MTGAVRPGVLSVCLGLRLVLVVALAWTAAALRWPIEPAEASLRERLVSLLLALLAGWCLQSCWRVWRLIWRHARGSR